MFLSLLPAYQYLATNIQSTSLIQNAVSDFPVQMFLFL